MVRRSIDNWLKHCVDVYTVMNMKFGMDKALRFMDRYIDRYDKFGRSFIDYKLASNLMEDYNHVKNIGTRLFVFVGPGGTGKSTLAKNVLYWFDPEFCQDFVKSKVEGIVKKLRSIPTTNAMRALLLDEPDSDIQQASKQGMKFRSIVGQWRQQQVFCALCATDLIDIPTYLFRKAEVIFFVPYHRRVILIRNRLQAKSYLLQEVRIAYTRGQRGYGVFWQMLKKSKHNRMGGVYSFRTDKVSPLDVVDNSTYLGKKATDYEKELDDFIGMHKTVADGLPTKLKGELPMEILIKNPDINTTQLAKLCDISARYARKLKLAHTKNTLENNTVVVNKEILKIGTGTGGGVSFRQPKEEK